MSGPLQQQDLLSNIERNFVGDHMVEGVGDQVVEFVEWFKKT